MSGKRTAAVGRFERLEARACPAAVAHLTHGGFTLVVRGDAAPDEVTITQDDARGLLTVSGVGSQSAVFSEAGVTAAAFSVSGTALQLAITGKTVASVGTVRLCRTA